MTRALNYPSTFLNAPTRHDHMYSKITRNIKVTVTPSYLDHQSSPGDHHYVWAYTVQLQNVGDETVQLINRTWHITDGFGRTQDVHGPGVVGEQPTLRPGDAFEYTSGTSLSTASGIMLGSYEMESDKGERFDIDIPPFSLDSPHQTMRPN